MGTNLNAVDTTLKIDGVERHFFELELTQKFNDHHHFKIKVDFQTFGEKWMENPTQIVQLISKEITISMTHLETGETNNFLGIITDVHFNGKHGEQNYYILEGCSPTVKLDGKPTLDSFIDLGLEGIVNEVVKKSESNVEVTVKPAFKGTIDYICQSEETVHDFLKRLSADYGEWYFYNGTKTFFGKPNSEKPVEITYDMEITHFNLTARALPPNYKRYNYLTHSYNEVKNAAPQQPSGVRGYIQAALDQSKKMYPKEATLPFKSNISTKKELEDMMKAEQYRTISHMFVFEAQSQTPKVKIGRLLKVMLPHTMEVPMKTVETFLVTEVYHYANQDKTYYNKFKGIPSEMENVPIEPIQAPIAYPQVAWVKSNENDKGLVKVQFQWQKELNKTTNFIRVQTPDAGKSDHVEKNRGMVHIPEVNDLVMIGFEYGNPDKPFIMGSIFPEDQSKGGGAGNHIKTITDKSNGQLMFNTDENGDWGITIKDRKGNLVKIDSKGSNITVNANHTVTINGGEAINLNSKKITLSGSEFISIQSPKINIGDRAGKLPNKTIDLAGEKISVEGGESISEIAPKLDLEGSNKAHLKSSKLTLSGTAKIDMKAPRINTN